jgi:hypothetical protein
MGKESRSWLYRAGRLAAMLSKHIAKGQESLLNNLVRNLFAGEPSCNNWHIEPHLQLAILHRGALIKEEPQEAGEKN